MMSYDDTIVISVIIPVYNVEAYLDRSLQSIVDQSYKNLEIILVDDGSTDRSGVLCDEWSGRDARIKVIHKANGGASDARNVGIEHATGKYIGFIDADDHIDRCTYEKLIYEAERYDADIVTCGYYKEYTDEKISMFADYPETIVMNREEALRSLFIFKYINESTCTKLIKYDLLKDERYKVGILTEDMQLLYRLICKADKIVAVPEAYYYYVYRDNSSSHSVKKSRRKLDQLDTLEEIYDDIVARYNHLHDEVLMYRCVWYVDTYEMIVGDRYYAEDMKRIKVFLKNNVGNIINSKYIDKVYKVMSIGIVYNVFSAVNSALKTWFKIKEKVYRR